MIAIDGKTLRGSQGAASEGKAIHVANAFATENQLILSRLATDKKPNEIIAILLLLDILDIKGATITINAAEFQKDKLKQICNQGKRALSTGTKG
ncbi:ISAs1 family transposase [Neochlamydia sp. EPS4]|uniref:ISAs1 family transposase n=1 Tax=Neochlamydia sp. EPS4 TaxID=1478175 RepID=UPI0006946C24|nr:ISAs1 family transposase [Neochlamydia sp. EPS4]